MLTAAHCLYDEYDEPLTAPDVAVLLGLHDRSLDSSTEAIR